MSDDLPQATLPETAPPIADRGQSGNFDAAIDLDKMSVRFPADAKPQASAMP